MVQSLLAERFNLKVHFETREVAVYALVLINPGKLDPGILLHSEGPACPTNQSDENPLGLDPDVWPPSCGALNTILPGMASRNPAVKKTNVHNLLMAARNTSIDNMIIRFPAYSGRLVVDRTGLRGPIDFRLEWTPEPDQPLANLDKEALTNEVFERTSLQQALRDQFGMKLESMRASVSFFVVDHVERPSEN
jgi:uncharacterized protein (TIGR03435 family)